MRILITGLLLFLAFGLFGQTVRTVGVVYTASAPVHTPSGQGAWIAVDTTSGSWYEWERTTGVWRDAGYRIQLTNTSGAPSYTPSKARGRVALNSGDSLYAYQAGAWACLNCVVAPDLSGYPDRTELGDSTEAIRNDFPTASDTATYLLQDSILVYYANGIEFDRDTIPFVTLTKILQIVSDSLAALPDSIMSGYGVAGYLPQYLSATKFDTTGVYWDAATGRLGIGIASSILARLHVRGPGASASTTALLVENASGTDIITANNAGSVAIPYTLNIGSTDFTTLYGLQIKRSGAFADILLHRSGVTTPATIQAFGGGSNCVGLKLEGNASSITTFNNGYMFRLGGAFGYAHTLGSAAIVKILGGSTFNPTSGNGSSVALELGEIVNQTGTASGSITGIDYNPTLTSVLGAHYGLLIRSGKVGFGTATPVASARVEISSTTEGFLPPRMTTAQRDAIASPSDGLMLFCTDCTATDGSTGVSQTYSSSAWRNHY